MSSWGPESLEAGAEAGTQPARQFGAFSASRTPRALCNHWWKFVFFLYNYFYVQLLHNASRGADTRALGPESRWAISLATRIEKVGGENEEMASFVDRPERISPIQVHGWKALLEHVIGQRIKPRGVRCSHSPGATAVPFFLVIAKRLYPAPLLGHCKKIPGMRLLISSKMLPGGDVRVKRDWNCKPTRRELRSTLGVKAQTTGWT